MRKQRSGKRVKEEPKRLTIVYKPIGELKLDPQNARVHSPRQRRQIARSIDAFGFNVPILADGEGNVICGHGRVLAAQILDFSEIPVILVEHLTPAQIRAFALADNKLTENASWDQRLLADAFRDLSLELDLDLELTGFSMTEIDLIVMDDSASTSGASDADDAPAPSGPPITRPGDVWEVQGHRIACCDALQEASYAAIMGDERADMVFTDPPYNVRIQDWAAGFGSKKYEEFAMGSGEMSEAEFTAFLISTYIRLVDASKREALIYTFTDWRHLLEHLVASRRAGLGLKNFCVWAKPTAGQGSFYRSQHELVLVQSAGSAHRNNIQLGRFGRHRPNLWEYPSPSAFGRAGEEGRLTLDHPTPKPVQLVADAILDCTARGDLVLDPFPGGGATLMAAERTGRRCRAIEIAPQYVDASIRRFRRFTGEDARRASDGRFFSELEREAGDVG